MEQPFFKFWILDFQPRLQWPRIARLVEDIAGHCLARWPQQELSFTSNVDFHNSREVVPGALFCLACWRLLLSLSPHLLFPLPHRLLRYPRWRCESGRDRDYDRYRYSDYDRPRYRSYARDCRTITIRRDDGSVRRIRRDAGTSARIGEVKSEPHKACRLSSRRTQRRSA
jgi:hypothetical protein